MVTVIMEDTQRIVKCGNLSLHSPGNFFKRRWISRYLVLYDGSNSGVKRLELFDSEIKFKKQIPAKIIPLMDCVRVVTCQRHRTTYTFEVRTSDQFYLLAAQSFQDMSDWVNCLRLVAFAEPSSPLSLVSRPNLTKEPEPAMDALLNQHSLMPATQAETDSNLVRSKPSLGCNQIVVDANEGSSSPVRARQRQPSMIGSCKPEPPSEAPLLLSSSVLGSLDTLTPTVRGQLIGATGMAGQTSRTASPLVSDESQAKTSTLTLTPTSANFLISTNTDKLDEAEENMLYCSIDNNPSEHNYRVKVIETELSLRCQLKCYQVTPANKQGEQPGATRLPESANRQHQHQKEEDVVFYQLIIGPQQLTLLNDYAHSAQPAYCNKIRQQGLWSWPYHCIRRYGFDKDNCLMFEAGRKCSSGPGQFIVQTPKAYNIYQDVVRFVGELRSLAESQARPAMAITQIPVTWAPKPSQSRTGFFSALRQLEAKTGAQQIPEAVATQATICKVNKRAICEETIAEDSGYEQGDDSVEGAIKEAGQQKPVQANANVKRKLIAKSGASRLGKLLNYPAGSIVDSETSLIRDVYNEINKFQASMAKTNSDSSTSDSSVSDLNHNRRGSASSRLSEIPSRSQFPVASGSFESNLTKTNRPSEFLVNSNTARRLIDRPTKALTRPNAHKHPEFDSGISVTEKQHLQNEVQSRLLHYPRSKQYRDDWSSNNGQEMDDLHNDTTEYLSLPGSAFSHHSSTLKPIPECTEPPSPVGSIRNSLSRQHVRRMVRSYKSGLASVGSIGNNCMGAAISTNNSPPVRFVAHPSRQALVRAYQLSQAYQECGIIKNPVNSQEHEPTLSARKPLLNSKQTTNHYVINDVQYARIARNIPSDCEACL